MTKSTEQSKFSNLMGAMSSIVSFRPQLSRRTALEASILGMVIVLAIIFRVIRIQWGLYLDAYDPLFQYRVTEYIVKNGYSAWFTWHDTMSWWPVGRDVAHSSYPGVPFSAAFIYHLIHAFGYKVSVYNVCLYFPVLMGVVTCIVAYFLGRDLGGSSVGLFTAFFLAISDAFIGRTSLGFFDTENIGIFGMAATCLLFLRSIDKKKSLVQKIAYAVAAGFFLGYIFASWGAARYVVGLLALFILASLITNLYERSYLISYFITMGIGFLIALLVPKLGIGYLGSVENSAVMLLILFLVIYEMVRERLEARKARLLMGMLLLLLVVGVFALQYLGVIKPLTGKFLRLLDPREALETPLYASVAEHHRSVWTNFFGSMGLTFVLGMLGTYLALSKLDGKRLFSVLFFISAVYFAGVMSRLSLILSIPASFMAAYGLKELMAPFIHLSRQRVEARRVRRRRMVFGLSRELAIVFAVFILVATLPTIWSTAASSNRPTTLACSGVSALLGGSYPQDWLQALSWMRDNLPDDAIVVSWWDYGYWIEAVANKTTLADGATKNASQIAQIGRIMMLNQSESLPILEKYGATHIVVFYTFNPSDPETQWPFGDNVKWSWMVQIGKLNLTDYYDESGNVLDKYYESNHYRLMTGQPDSAFELVYASDFNFVLVYKVDCEAVQT
jgi:dolichyl-diphosphooligosaccharide--protein glycosyltransferase